MSQIAIATRTGSMQVKAYTDPTVSLVVTQRIAAGAGMGDYTITHTRSGCCVGGTFATLKSARACLKELLALGDWSGPSASFAGTDLAARAIEVIKRYGERGGYGTYDPTRALDATKEES